MDKNTFKFRILALFSLLGLFSCVLEEPIDTYSRDRALIRPGDIVVSSTTMDSAILLDKDGNFKKLLYNVDNNLESIYGVNWNGITNEILLTVNGSPDRVMGVSVYDGSVREIIRHPLLNGNIYGVTLDSDGDYLVIESNSVEKFTKTGSRFNDGNFPALNILSGGTQINSLPNSGFVMCGTSSDRVRTFDDTGSQVAEAQSGVAGTTNGYGCAPMSNGNIVTSWDGTTDTVIVFSADLTTQIATFSDVYNLNAPRGVAVKANGNILIADAGYEWIVEIESDGTFVRTLGSGVLNDPWQLIEVPRY